MTFLLGCATPKSSETAPPATVSQAQLRACEACRVNFDLCQRRPQQERGASCIDEMMNCLRMQSLDPGQCAGAN